MPTADELLSATTVRELARCLATAAPGRSFPAVERSAGSLGGLSLSERSRAVRDALLADLPGGYAELAGVVGVALADPAFTGWMIWPVSEAVAVRAAPGPDLVPGLALLAGLTSRLTGEFALRTFLDADLEGTLAVVRGWTTHPDEHVRRLASEGTRPRLPWARRVRELLARPEATVPILDALHRDESEYVRRSVANHLNDLAHAHPELVTAVARRWLDEPGEHTRQVVRHGLRTLVKKGDPAALVLLGFGPPAGITVAGPLLTGTAVPVGGELRFEFALTNGSAAPMMLAVDYVIHHRKANASLAPKVFKLTTRTLEPGATTTIVRRHSFAPISTRTYHPGEHAVEIQVNGTRHGRTTFELTPLPE